MEEGDGEEDKRVGISEGRQDKGRRFLGNYGIGWAVGVYPRALKQWYGRSG